MIRYLKLPFRFDAARMLEEIRAIAQPWKPHFNQWDYEGTWSGLSLRAPGGSADNLLTENLQGDNVFADTPLLEQCPYIREVLQAIECPQTSVRLLQLDRGAVVKEHTDAGLYFEEGEVRLHIPVITHELVEFHLDGHRLAMQAGECWYINAGLPHRLSNSSPVHRIHLVVDCVVNAWLTDLFLRDDLPLKSVKDTTAAQRRLEQQLIAELRRSNDPARQQLADELEARDGQPAGTPDLVTLITGFIQSVGIDVVFQPLEGACFLPGMSIEGGKLLVDRARLEHPGDLLHEAGHIAVVPQGERHTLNAISIGLRPNGPAEEMTAMAWSYAACHKLQIDPEIVFHEDGYKGGSESLLQSLRSPMPIGAPMLQYYGMALLEKIAAERGLPAYPAMLHWTNPQEA